MANCDNTPPVLASTSQVNGAYLQQVTSVTFTLSAMYDPVDDADVIASVSVKDSGNNPVSGTVSESNDRFTFTPDVSPMADDIYTVYFT